MIIPGKNPPSRISDLLSIQLADNHFDLSGRNKLLQSIFIDPMYDRLRADPRYPELVRDVKPPQWSPTLAVSSLSVSAK